MSKKKGKFDLTKLVHDGVFKEGEVLHFVSDPKKTCTIFKHPSGEFKVKTDAGITKDGVTTLHAFAQFCLGQEPPEHATRWFANAKGETVYQLWQAGEDEGRWAA